MDVSSAREDFLKFLIDGETIFAAFKTVRDQVVFTNKRVIAANVQGITGSKVDYTSLPYSKINAFSIETSGTFDLDCE
ncbi:PH domain-containing protein, partial [Vibrio parahaemolyticus]|nr:PH domain-containing protein [Vibrio parahaemolyticus]